MSEPEAEISIRPIEPRDAAQVAILVDQLGYECNEAEVTRWIKTVESRRDEQIAFVACIGQQVIGWLEVCIEYRLQSAPYALIGGLVVKDGYRNHKVGLRLCARAEAWTWEHGLSTLRVTSRSTRTDAHRFYLKNGYTQTKLSHVFEKRRPE